MRLEERLLLRLDEDSAVTRDMVSRKADEGNVRAWLAEKADLEAVAEELEARASQEEVGGLGLCYELEVGGGGLRLTAWVAEWVDLEAVADELEARAPHEFILWRGTGFKLCG